MKTISIIITVFNKIDYLERCITSVLDSSYEDIEVIVIDDFSTDGSRELVSNLVRRDARIVALFNDENKGAAYSRNKGIQQASGKYLFFLDADDYIEINAIDNWRMLLENNKADGCFIMIHCSGDKENENIYQEVYTGRELIARFVDNNEMFLYACGAIWRSDFLRKNNITFSNLKIGEGGLFILEALLNANRVVVSDYQGYHYEVNSGSVSVSDNSQIYAAMGQAKQLMYMILKLKYDKEDPEILHFINWYLNKNIGGIKNLKDSDIENFKKSLSDNEKFIFDLLREAHVDKKNLLSYEDRKLLAQNEGVVLYGAGYEVMEAIKICNELDLEIKDIIVTKGYAHPKNVYGYRIKEFDGNKAFFDISYPVLVTAHEKHHSKIESLLRQAGVDTIIFMREE